MTEPKLDPSIRRAVATSIYIILGLIVVVVVVGLWRGDDVGVTLENAGSVTLTGSGSDDAPSTTISPEILEEELDDAQQDLRADNFESTIESGFAGRWDFGAGITYVIEEFGPVVTIQEQNVGGIVTAVGEGQVVGDTFQFGFQNTFGVFGSGTLNLSADGKELSGFLTDGFTTTPIELVRQS